MSLGKWSGRNGTAQTDLPKVTLFITVGTLGH